MNEHQMTSDARMNRVSHGRDTLHWYSRLMVLIVSLTAAVPFYLLILLAFKHPEAGFRVSASSQTFIWPTSLRRGSSPISVVLW